MSKTELVTLDSAMDTMKKRAPRWFGTFAVVALVFVVTYFVKNQWAQSKMAPWQSLLVETSVQFADASEIAGIVDEVRGTDAEPLARLWQAYRTIPSQGQVRPDDIIQAMQILKDLSTDFPRHYVNEVALANPGEFAMDSPNARVPLVPRLFNELDRLQAWGAENLVKDSNPASTSSAQVTLVTDQGELIIQLYPDKAPASCAAFVRMADRLKDRRIANRLAGKWVEIGQTEAGEDLKLDDHDETFPPFEENDLYHYAGAVCFKQMPFSKGDRYGAVKVWLETDFNADGQSVVFGQLTEASLAVAKSLAEGESETERPSRLATPVIVTEVRMSGTEALQAPDEAPDEGEE